jgi:exonuclease SbcC
MIEYIHIKNFQSHTDTRIDFCKGNTAITGLSMSGKTAIKRAFEWVRKNRPTGFRFNYRYGDEPTSVEIGVDGHIIRLKKSSKALDAEGHKAIYSIKYPTVGDVVGNTINFTDFGTSVPEEVTDLLGVSDISIQDQLDAYLLVISSVGNIAQTINRITGIDIGDKWLKDINRMLSQITKDEKRLQGELDFLQEDIKKYEGIDDIDALVQKASLLQAKCDLMIQQHSSLVDIVTRYKAAILEIKEVASKLSNLKELEKAVHRIIEKMQEDKETREAIVDMILLGESGKEIAGAIKFLEPEVEKYESYIELKITMDEIGELAKAYELKRIMRDRASAKAEKSKRELADFLVSIGKCYVCGGDINDHQKIIESL